MKNLPFFAETHFGNTETDTHYEVQAPNLILATALVQMYIAGLAYCNVQCELRGITAYRRKGVKYERLG